MSEPIDEDLDNFLVRQMVKNYGDLLKVSRTPGVSFTLPALRTYLTENPYVREEYLTCIESERDGQGLTNVSSLNSLIDAQLESFVQGDYKNSKMYADEIKRLITDGKKEGTLKEVAGKLGVASQAKTDEIIESPLDVDVETITADDAKAIREMFMGIDGFRLFSLWAFEIQMGFKFQEQDFHRIIFEFCQKIVEGEISRGIVCIPPRHSKTQVLSIFLPLYSFCRNPSSHNIITSYAEDVVGESSGYVRTIMTSPLFQKIFPAVKMDPSKRSLERWGTTRGGVMHAVPTGGKMTGKGAGVLAEVYSGVFVVDDAIKPKDAYSNAVRSEINDRYDNTFMSRLATDGGSEFVNGVTMNFFRTPMVIIMQRVHDEDLVGYLLRGNSADKYIYLNIPGVISKECGSERWYKTSIAKQAYTHAIPYLYDLERGEGETALWASRKNLVTLKAMEEATPYTFNSQYLGDPAAKGVGLVKEDWWKEYPPEYDKRIIQRTFMTGDTASTSKNYSDYSVIIHWGVTRTHELMLLDVILGKWETPELKIEIEKFWKEKTQLDLTCPQMLPTALYLEDKSSGQFLNQQFVRDGNVRVMPVPKDKTSGDKVARFLNTIPYWSQGRILMPTEHKHKAHMMREIINMTGEGSGTGHDDVVDNISDAVAVAFSGPQANYQNWL